MKKIIEMLTSVAGLLIPQLKKADSVESNKETKEMLVGVNEIGLFACQKLADGAQFSDATDFYLKLTQDDEFKAKVAAAYENRQKIPAEIKDMDAGESLELVVVQAEYIPKIMDALSKEETQA